jgi:hypothetical protein
MQLRNWITILSCFSLLLTGSCYSQDTLSYEVVNTFLKQFDDDVALYYKSQNHKNIPIDLPITKFKLQGYDQVNAYNIDSLVTQQDIAAWNKAVKRYTPMAWDSTELSSRKMVEQEPAHLDDPIPDPDKTPYPIEHVLYVSAPFFNNEFDKVLIFSTKKSGPTTFSRWYYILGKKDNEWIIEAKGFISG